MRQAYYRSTIEKFLNTNPDEIIGQLNLGGTAFVRQWTIGTISWDSSIQIYKKSFEELLILRPEASEWTVLLEYEIPRLGTRIDLVLIADDLIFVVEFKYDRKKYELADERQAEDYALDLSDFHLESRSKTIIPILLAPLAPTSCIKDNLEIPSFVKPCLKANSVNFSNVLLEIYHKYHCADSSLINAHAWEKSEYQPTPTIVQAARALFAGQQVENITKSHAEATNLTSTTDYLIENINKARAENKKIVCFVTGVPGAGKTLVGLNIVHEKEAFGGHDFDTAYFSGNGPLIKVLREALARDHYQTQKALFETGEKLTKPVIEASRREVKTKIQNLHTFIKDGIRKSTAPTERIVVFDEAQRCWDARHFFNQSKRNQNREENPFELQEKSEAELLFEFMDRHEGWAVIIALVGGGQEINTGEAGISEWGKSLKAKYSEWEVHISPQLLYGDATTAGKTLFEGPDEKMNVQTNEHLHLSIGQRSFRVRDLNTWVNAVLNNDPAEAARLAESIQEAYPLKITRDINQAKEWLKSKMLGTKRIGLVASSGGLRLRPYGINVKEQIDEAKWFLNDEKDIRSSYYLEMVATEFAVQGLELDWTAVCWDADLKRDKDQWNFKSFSGTKWQNMESLADRQFLINKYRVLLTRAREGLVIFVPKGDVEDQTRLPEFYNPIYEYLKACGMQEI